MQFERAESTQPGGVPRACDVCKKPLVDFYFLAGRAKICAGCRTGYDAELAKGSKVGRFFRAAAFGLSAAIVGAVIYYAWVKLTNFHLSLIAIIIGVMVGVAVKKGSDGRGGWVYQGMAMFLTYLSIVGMFVPEIVEGLRDLSKKSQAQAATAKEPGGDPAAPSVPSNAEPAKDAKESKGGCVMGMVALVVLTAFVLFFAMAFPILSITESPIFLLIIGFAVYEAWKINKRVKIDFKGPFRLGAATPETPAGG
jgi:hypothetical protein